MERILGTEETKVSKNLLFVELECLLQAGAEWERDCLSVSSVCDIGWGKSEEHCSIPVQAPLGREVRPFAYDDGKWLAAGLVATSLASKSWGWWWRCELSGEKGGIRAGGEYGSEESDLEYLQLDSKGNIVVKD